VRNRCDWASVVNSVQYGHAVNIVEPILFQCRINGEQPAICAPGTNFEAMNYAQLEFMLNALTRAVLTHGFQRGQVVGVLIGNKILHVVLLLALARIGVVTVSCRGRSLPKELGAVAVMTDTAGPFANVDRIIVLDREWARGDGTPLANGQFTTNGDELCRIILTSGSTGVAKGVAFSHGKMFEKNARLDYTRLDRWSRSARLFCDLGLSSSLGFYYVLYMLSRGGMIMLMGEDTVGTLQALNLFEMENMATSPYGLAEYLKFYESQPEFACNFDHILVAGGALTRQLAARAWPRMSPRLITTYGAAETGAIASGDARITTEVPGAVGFILPEAEAEIVDTEDQPLPRGEEGIVRVRTAQAADCYFGDPQTSARYFRDGWFYPGDFGYLREDNLLVVGGRQETRLNVGGDKVNPEIVEEAVASFPAVADCAVVGIANELGIEQIHALIVPRAVFDENNLREHCAAKLQRAFIPVRFLAVEKIPRNDMAKIDRGKLAEVAKAS
jgi:acyl-coenzyme A synthetase/AMP-(fatty) acid ligase